ncbi:MAG: hypothetical protein E7Z87_04020 [Cyanobacteria bacterium SIG26]|nr:hypothetical protein [Cyanobacteria bacterium SIG26]
MGMSASQARFLCLTARKSNVEFEGQQINQQRTSLSNTSGAYYSELCNMSVPTPPSLDEFTKVSYVFNDGAFSNTITSMIAKQGGKYSISYIQQWQDDYSIVSAASSVVSRNQTDSTNWVLLSEEEKNNIKYFYITNLEFDEYIEVHKENRIDGGGIEYYYCADPNNTDEKTYIDINEHNKVTAALVDENADNPKDAVTLLKKDPSGNYFKEGTITTYTYSIGSAKLRKLGSTPTDKENDPYLRNLSDEQIKDLMAQEGYYKDLLNEKNGNLTNLEDYYVRYIKDATTGAYVPYFYSASDIESEKYNDTGLATEGMNCYTIGSATKTKEVLNQFAKVEKDSTGRYIGIKIYTDDKFNEETAIEYSLTTNTTTDEAAYEDAMNKYNYEQFQYDQKVQEINSKIEIIQQQDKSLELELKHLDTEQSAIDAELDAVKKVISKNVDSSFKTFSA